MSRSYKKRNMIVKDSNNKYMKRQASVKVRRYPLNRKISNGSGYKKLLSSWDICDYRWIWTRRDAIKEYQNKNKRRCIWNAADKFDSLNAYLSYHDKCTKRK